MKTTTILMLTLAASAVVGCAPAGYHRGYSSYGYGGGGYYDSPSYYQPGGVIQYRETYVVPGYGGGGHGHRDWHGHHGGGRDNDHHDGHHHNDGGGRGGNHWSRNFGSADALENMRNSNRSWRQDRSGIERDWRANGGDRDGNGRGRGGEGFGNHGGNHQHRHRKD